METLYLARNLRSRWKNKAWGASPRYINKIGVGAREAGGSAVARFAGSNALLPMLSWGWRPKLYSSTCFAGSGHNTIISIDAVCFAGSGPNTSISIDACVAGSGPNTVISPASQVPGQNTSVSIDATLRRKLGKGLRKG